MKVKKFFGRLLRRAITVAGGGLMVEGDGALAASGLLLVLAELAAREFLEARAEAKKEVIQ